MTRLTRYQMIEILKLEHQFLRVPFERYKKTIRANHCVAERGISDVISRVSNAATDGNVSIDDAVTLLKFLVWRLQELKWNLVEGNRVEQLQAQKYLVRFDHLESAELENMSEWNSTRLNRILVDYMLRMSYYDTAVKLAECKNIQDLVDIDTDAFQEAKIVTDALQNRNVAPALAWCAENKSRLKESKVELELQLRLQEFIELVRDENYLQALNYANNQLTPWGDLEEVKQAMATLALSKDTSIPTYKVLFETEQWDKLAKQFKHEFFKLHGMTLKPLLNIYLQAGLSALKTPYCYEDDCTKEDPLSQEPFRVLASPLPYSKLGASKLVCYITKEPMERLTAVAVMPNGYFYSFEAVSLIASRNHGWIKCPRTGSYYHISQVLTASIP
ncbi:hypothetical protein QN277_011620 [Acacia crassicarpa]|uniref:CTLH domain-containing protein n=1 Tax=Acacia crassicarpa TaxID=499986 RepID=A0AAE1TCX8_9FABA|nr:hypothetical protein QN277_011620 [Acacia crassicarpa]